MMFQENVKSILGINLHFPKMRCNIFCKLSHFGAISTFQVWTSVV